MKFAGLLTSFLLLLICAPSLAAQERDGTVALPGQLRLDLAGEYLRVDSRFGNASTPWSSAGTLDRTRLTAVTAPADHFDAFLEATGGSVEDINGSALNLGVAAVDGVVAVRHLPVRVALGIFRRFEIGVTVPILRTQRTVRRLDIEPGNLGLNPAPTENGAKLTPVGEAGTQLGSAPLLPIADSPAGLLLQERALAATGETLDLPTEPLDQNGLQEAFGYERAPYDTGIWEVGDLEMDLRIQLLSSFPGQFPLPESSGGYRLTVVGGYRLAAPFTPEPGALGTPPTSSSIGFSGPHGGAVGDFWIGRSWTTVGFRATRLSRDLAKVALPAPIELRPGAELAMDPYLGDGLDVWIVPRIRLTREISLGGVLDGHFLGAADDAGVVDPGKRRMLSAGFSLRFSSLPGMTAGDEVRPIDASFGYLAPISGTDGAQRIGRAFLQVTLLPRLWGGGGEVEQLPPVSPEPAPAPGEEAPRLPPISPAPGEEAPQLPPVSPEPAPAPGEEAPRLPPISPAPSAEPSP